MYFGPGMFSSAIYQRMSNDNISVSKFHGFFGSAIMMKEPKIAIKMASQLGH